MPSRTSVVAPSGALFGAVALLLAFFWQPLWARFVLLPRAAAELVSPDADPRTAQLPPCTTRLVERWRSGDRTLARLLVHEDPKVWISVAEILEYRFSGSRHFGSDWERLREFRRDLYDLDPQYAIRYHLLGPIADMEWRPMYFVPGDGEAHMGQYDWRYFWTARPDVPPAADPASIAFLRRLIFDYDFDSSELGHHTNDLRLKAVDALVAIWNGTRSASGAPSPLERELRGMIDSVLEADLRFRVAVRMLQAEHDEPWSGISRLSDWEYAVGIDEGVSPWDFEDEDDGAETLTLDSEYDWGNVEDVAFRALFMVDDPRVDEIRARLAADPSTAARVAALFDTERD